MKQCPVCKSPVPLDTAVCPSCQHQFRTKFNAPKLAPEPTQVMPPAFATPTVPYAQPLVDSALRMKRKRIIAWVIGVALLLLCFNFLLYCADRARLDKRGTVDQAMIKVYRSNIDHVREKMGDPDSATLEMNNGLTTKIWRYRCKDGVLVLEINPWGYVENAYGRSN